MKTIGSLPHDHNNPIPDHLLRELPDMEEIRIVADAMRQLGDPSRLRIFWILCHCEECVTNIAAMTGMSAPAVSHHLRLLKDNHLAVSRRSGKEMYYTAGDTPLVKSLHKYIEEIAQITCPAR